MGDAGLFFRWRDGAAAKLLSRPLTPGLSFSCSFLLWALLYLAQQLLIPSLLEILLSFFPEPAVRRISSLLLFVIVWMVARHLVQLAGELPNYETNIACEPQTLKSGDLSKIRCLSRVVEKFEQESPVEKPASELAEICLDSPKAPTVVSIACTVRGRLGKADHADAAPSGRKCIYRDPRFFMLM